MTEKKRFTRIVDHSCKEVRIFDEIVNKIVFNIFFNDLDSAICLNGALTEVVDLLNYYENTCLHYEKRMFELRKENEQLKQSLQNKMESDAYWEQKAKQRILLSAGGCPLDEGVFYGVFA